MTDTERRTRVRSISERSSEPLLVEMTSEDRFLVEEHVAALACKNAISEQALGREFRRLFDYLREWCRSRTDRYSACLVAFANERLNVYLLTPGEDYSAEAQSEATALDLDLALRFEGCPLAVMALPASPISNVQALVPVDRALRLCPREEPAGEDAHRS